MLMSPLTAPRSRAQTGAKHVKPNNPHIKQPRRRHLPVVIASTKRGSRTPKATRYHKSREYNSWTNNQLCYPHFIKPDTTSTLTTRITSSHSTQPNPTQSLHSNPKPQPTMSANDYYSGGSNQGYNASDSYGSSNQASGYGGGGSSYTDAPNSGGYSHQSDHQRPSGPYSDSQRYGAGHGSSSGTSYAGGYGSDSDLSGAASTAQADAGESGDSNIFSSVLGMLGGKKQQLQDEDVDEEEAVREHKAYYGSGGSGGGQATEGGMGAAAAMQAMKMFNSGEGGGSSSGGGQSKFIGLAMSQAAKLFDQQQSQGNVQQGESKNAVVQKAAEMAFKYYMKSEVGGGSSGGSGGGIGGLMNMASKFLK